MVDGTFTPTANVTISDVPSGTAVTETPAQEPGAGTAAPETEVPEAGGSQETTEDGQSQPGQRRGWSKVDEIRDLRAWRREARQREAGLNSEISQMRQQLEELRQLQQPGSGRTARNPGEFWQDPEGALERTLEDRLAGLENRLLDRFSQTREMEAQAVALRQEQESSVEFIRSQPNYSPDLDEDLIDIIEAIPMQTRASLTPSWVAEYAWNKLMMEKGVGNRSMAKARASAVVGQPPAAGLEGKIWSKAEFDRACDQLEKAGIKADDNLVKELTNAAKEGRVR